jgi:hypothetical protein
MLIAKINPPAIKIVETTPFNSTTKNLDYMSAAARPYVAGASITDFQIQFGRIVIDETDTVKFYNESNSQLSMTSEELSTWGTNDETLLTLIATKLGVSVIEVISIGDNNF